MKKHFLLIALLYGIGFTAFYFNINYITEEKIHNAAELIEEMHKVMQEIDIFVHPSWGSPVLRITNMTGHPTVVVPNGFRNGRPTSISFTGQLFMEEEVLAVAKFLQENTEWDEMHPEGF